MRTERWGKAITIWGLVVLAYCAVVWPRHSTTTPFSQDEAELNARIDVMVQFFAFWGLPLAVVWLMGQGDRSRAADR